MLGYKLSEQILTKVVIIFSIKIQYKVTRSHIVILVKASLESELRKYEFSEWF